MRSLSAKKVVPLKDCTLREVFVVVANIVAATVGTSWFDNIRSLPIAPDNSMSFPMSTLMYLATKYHQPHYRADNVSSY